MPKSGLVFFSQLFFSSAELFHSLGVGTRKQPKWRSVILIKLCGKVRFDEKISLPKKSALFQQIGTQRIQNLPEYPILSPISNPGAGSNRT